MTRSGFVSPGDTILLMGGTRDELGGSEYLAAIHGVVGGAPPDCDLAKEKAAIDALHEMIVSGAICSAHDCSDGGLAVALAESCIANMMSQVGASVDLDAAYADMNNASIRGVFFGETQARFVLSSNAPTVVEAIARKHGVPIHAIGIVLEKHEGFRITLKNSVIETPVKALSTAWHDAIPNIMSSAVVAPAESDVPALSGA